MYNFLGINKLKVGFLACSRDKHCEESIHPVAHKSHPDVDRTYQVMSLFSPFTFSVQTFFRRRFTFFFPLDEPIAFS
jgi:hypothetical protein